jgi:ADP-ribose pyrophosphatase YjhB (NUDIX family)
MQAKPSKDPSRVYNPNMTSYIQDCILTALLKTEKPVRYSAIKSEKVDNDLFNYHLQFLVKKNYIIKSEENLYTLSKKGKEHVQQFDIHGQVHNYFKVSVLTYVLNEQNQILLQKRLRHPYYGDTGVVSGKVDLGETVEMAASRKFAEETGLKCAFKLAGVHRKTRRDNNKRVIEDTLYHVCFGKNPTGKLVTKNDFGENYWADLQEALRTQSTNITKSSYSEKVLRLVFSDNTKHFYFHEDLALDNY